jgi:Family of unknown function (DUF5682)
MAISIYGIRHHGPGSAKHLLQALEIQQPDIILIEGPPEGNLMLPWVSHEHMKPPVALLVYVPDEPQLSVFYPFAAFSPEWNAIKYAQQKNIPVRFIDMPMSHSLIYEKKEKTIQNEEEIDVQVGEVITADAIDKEVYFRKNPTAYLAEIAGFEDEEEWWERQFEITDHSSEVFKAVHVAMQALREHYPTIDNKEMLREAFMRKAIRLAQKEMFTNISVVCGAWHVPALDQMPTQKHDDDLLKNLPKTKVETTWIPWTDNRLAFESGYGAGVQSPGWYSHCWNNSDTNGIQWMSHVASTFRKNRIQISTAHVIEAVRLANALADMRGFSKPSLKEFTESTQTVMCMGDALPLQLIKKDLIVGHQMGVIPDGTPQVPLQFDFEKQIKTLRFKLSDDELQISLDLRESFDLNKSILLHRLQVLNIPWGHLKYARSKGTFKEDWAIRWTPELHIKLIEKAPWGNTTESACHHFITSTVEQSIQLKEISELLEKSIPAELNESIRVLVQKLDVLAASSTDTVELMDTIIPLAQISRYGNVRNTDMETIHFVLQSLFYRMIAGLPVICMGIDEDQANLIAEKMKATQKMVAMLADDDLKDAWQNTLQKIVLNDKIAPTILGCSCKILYDVQFFTTAQTSLYFSKALSQNQVVEFKVYWLEGFLKDAANVLIVEDDIWHIVNDWVAGLEMDIFLEILPLLRRTFSNYNSVERQKIAGKVSAGKQMSKSILQIELNEQRAKRVLPIIEKLLNI